VAIGLKKEGGELNLDSMKNSASLPFTVHGIKREPREGCEEIQSSAFLDPKSLCGTKLNHGSQGQTKVPVPDLLHPKKVKWET